MGRIEARPALLAALLAASSALAGCGRSPAPQTPNNAAAPAPSGEEPITVVVEPGVYYPDLPSPGPREYDEARSFGLREVLPPPAPAAQVPLRSSLGLTER